MLHKSLTPITLLCTFTPVEVSLRCVGQSIFGDSNCSRCSAHGL